MKIKNAELSASPPKFHRVRQSFDATCLSDVAGETRRQLENSGVQIPKGKSIAITAGSRGIDNIAIIIRETVKWVAECGGKPFIVPAMGSHGGATAKGQTYILEKFGITEEKMGCPIRSSMDVVQIKAPGIPAAVFMDKLAYQSAGVILINRIKPHTEFHGDYESGLVKMLSIGLGKHAQALAIHAYGQPGLHDLMPRIAKRLLDTKKILLGVGILENAYDKTHTIRAIPANRIMQEEKKLLEFAYTLMPSLPLDDVHVLIVEEMGKNISGTGMDPNIIGQRYRTVHRTRTRDPHIEMLICRDLAKGTKGNATGMGFADIIPQNFFKKIDFRVTYENVRTASAMTVGKMPMVAKDDREAWEWALRGACVTDSRKARVARIRNTLDLGEILVSDALLKDVLKRPNTKLVERNISLFGSGRKMAVFKTGH
ncbi:MAG: DUF2088 domain-containing protein [Chthoniobacterales bacterium]